MLYDELKALAPSLSPSHRVSGSEVGDVLSALIAYVEHGEPILQAAQTAGQQGIVDFVHELFVHEAQQAGGPAPVKGQPLQAEPAVGRRGPAPAVSKTDFDKLAGLVEKLVASLSTGAAAPAPDAPPAPEQPFNTATD